MHNVFLFAAVAAIAFFINVEIPADPRAGINADFEPTAQAAILLASLPAPQHAVEGCCLL
jgi:hypothetical protein